MIRSVVSDRLEKLWGEAVLHWSEKGATNMLGDTEKKHEKVKVAGVRTQTCTETQIQTAGQKA